MKSAIWEIVTMFGSKLFTSLFWMVAFILCLLAWEAQHLHLNLDTLLLPAFCFMLAGVMLYSTALEATEGIVASTVMMVLLALYARFQHYFGHTWQSRFMVMGAFLCFFLALMFFFASNGAHKANEAWNRWWSVWVRTLFYFVNGVALTSVILSMMRVPSLFSFRAYLFMLAGACFFFASLIVDSAIHPQSEEEERQLEGRVHQNA